MPTCVDLCVPQLISRANHLTLQYLGVKETHRILNPRLMNIMDRTHPLSILYQTQNFYLPLGQPKMVTSTHSIFIKVTTISTISLQNSRY